MGSLPPADALLDSYSPERRGATLDIFAQASKSTRFMSPPTRGHRLLRDALKDFGQWKNKYAGKLTTPAELEAAIKEKIAIDDQRVDPVWGHECKRVLVTRTGACSELDESASRA